MEADKNSGECHRGAVKEHGRAEKVRKGERKTRKGGEGQGRVEAERKRGDGQGRTKTHRKR